MSEAPLPEDTPLSSPPPIIDTVDFENEDALRRNAACSLLQELAESSSQRRSGSDVNKRAYDYQIALKLMPKESKNWLNKAIDFEGSEASDLRNVIKNGLGSREMRYIVSQVKTSFAKVVNTEAYHEGCRQSRSKVKNIKTTEQ
jgi:hypothetical protein